MPFDLRPNQAVFDANNFSAGTVSKTGDEVTLTPQGSVFPEDSVVVVSFSVPNGDTITRFDVFDSQAAFAAATSID